MAEWCGSQSCSDSLEACEDKTSQWITQVGPLNGRLACEAEARQDAHGLRADSQAILVGLELFAFASDGSEAAARPSRISPA